MTEVLKLNIPYRSQWDNDATSHSADCGPTCLAMLLNAHGSRMTPDSLYRFIPPKTANQFVSMAELMIAGRQNNLSFQYKQYPHQHAALGELLQLLDKGYAPIALVKYAPWQPFTGNRFQWGHFVVVTGYDNEHIYMHDPLFGMWAVRSRGSHLQMRRALFMQGWGGFPVTENPNFAVLIPHKSLIATPPAPPVAVDPPPPAAPRQKPVLRPIVKTPVVEEPAVTVSPDELSDTDKRRIFALAGYLDTHMPDLEEPDQVSFWMKYLGDWGKQVQSYEVRSGDTMGIIAYRFYKASGRWRAIQRYNRLAGDMLWVGQWLKIPLHDAANSHLNQELRDRVETIVRTASEDRSSEALNYNEIGRNTIGMGFVDESNVDAVPAG